LKSRETVWFPLETWCL